MIRASINSSGNQDMSRLLIAALLLAAAGLTSATANAVDAGASAAPAAAATAPAAAATAPAAVAGTWALTVETSAGTGTPTLLLQQDGSALSGTYKGRFGDSAITGAMQGNAIHFTFAISGPMGSAEVTYAGTVEGDLMHGTMQMGTQMDGKFSGRRQ